MLPETFLDALPKAFRYGDDAARDALVAMADTHLAEWYAETRGLLFANRADRAPEVALSDLGVVFGANILPVDDERTRRRKISTAAFANRYRTAWIGVKPIIDSVVGTDSEVVNFVAYPQWIWVNDEADVESGYLWAVWGGGSDDYGIDWAGGVDDLTQAGIVSIDVKTNTLSSGGIAQLRESLRDAIPSYFRMNVGYFDGTIYTVYPGGVIG